MIAPFRFARTAGYIGRMQVARFAWVALLGCACSSGPETVAEAPDTGGTDTSTGDVGDATGETAGDTGVTTDSGGSDAATDASTEGGTDGGSDVIAIDSGEVCTSAGGKCTDTKLACQCCPGGGPTVKCLCTTLCKADADCTDSARPKCNQAKAGDLGICTDPAFTCCWGCK